MKTTEKVVENKKSTKERGNVLLIVLCVAAVLIFAGYKYGVIDRLITFNSADEVETAVEDNIVIDYSALEVDDSLQSIIDSANEQMILVKNSDSLDVAKAADEKLLGLLDLALQMDGNYAVSVYNYVSCVDAYVVNVFNTQYDAEKYADEAAVALERAQTNYDSLTEIRIQFLRDAGFDDADIVNQVSK